MAGRRLHATSRRARRDIDDGEPGFVSVRLAVLGVLDLGATTLSEADCGRVRLVLPRLAKSPIVETKPSIVAVAGAAALYSSTNKGDPPSAPGHHAGGGN